MNSNFSSSFSRRGPDNITEELVAVLSGPKSYEFKALFSSFRRGCGLGMRSAAARKSCVCALTTNFRILCNTDR